MPVGEELSGPLLCPLANDTEQRALQCLRDQSGSFYDACAQRCVTDVYFTFLSQNLELEHFVYGVLFPVLVLLVVVANVLVALVLSQKHMITPTNVVLKYMALADLCVGLVPLPWNFFYHSLRNYEKEQRLELWWCYMYKYSMDAIPPVFHNIAMWLTVLLAGQRFISIEYPLRSRELCSVRNVRIATFCIAITSLLCGLPKWVDFYYDVFDGWVYTAPGRLEHVRRCVSGFTFVVRTLGSNTFFNVYFWTRVFGFILIPSFLLTILNYLLIRGIRRAQKRKELLLKEKKAREAQRQIDNNSTSLMLVMVVSIFLVVNLPQAIFIGLLCISSTLGWSSQLFQGVFPVAFMLVSNMLVMATYPINFGIYCFMSSSFRETFRLLFVRCGKRHRLGTHSTASAIGRLSAARRSDPSVSVQLSGKFSGDGASAVLRTDSNEPKEPAFL